MLYTSNMLLEKYKGFADPYDKIRRECERGDLIRIRRGLYEDDPDTPPYCLASYIYGPSYISFEYVLSGAGLIPEHTVNVTSATFRKNRSRKYLTQFGTFVYCDVPAAVFSLGADCHEENGYVYMIASPERALCDELYKVRQARSVSDFDVLLEKDLRIDRRMLLEMNADEICRIAPLYRRKNLVMISDFLKKGKLHE